MRQNKPPDSKVTRRDLLKYTAAASAAMSVTTVGDSTAAPSTKSNRIIEENNLPGTTDWQLTYTRVDPKTQFRCPWIEGYVSKASVRPGGSIDIMVSTNPAGPFKIDLYRLGHYGGKGGRHMKTLGPFEGATQADPDIGPNRLRECSWSPCATLDIPDDWLSGVYLGKLSLTEDRLQSYVIFIVHDDRQADLLFQCSDNTWQAYNRWPGHYALYDDGKSNWALKSGTKVSYDRPYGKYCQILDNPLSQGSGEFLLWEFPLAFWMEREGYDVTYCSNTDVHADAECVRRVKGFISVGHDEYWSLEQFNHVKAAVDDGLNAGFFSGNTCCFVTPFEPGSDGTPNRIIERAGRFGGLSEAEKVKMGPFKIHDAPSESSLIGGRTTTPYNGSGDWIISDDSSWVFKDAGVKNGDRIPGLIGWEFHGEPADIPGLKIVAEGIATNTGNEKARWTATTYPGKQGNWVFNAATIWWAQGLSVPPGHMPPISHYGRPHGEDERVQQITRNVLNRFIES
ncbi:MAG TPA: twin-arginine translocation signal domain-containing protein [Candidatus Hydrogenedentes bacterium]|nr:twin-arginine translocation signal domain-containing protein [Candidatus Hydrogenedentota bacterium]